MLALQHKVISSLIFPVYHLLGRLNFNVHTNFSGYMCPFQSPRSVLLVLNYLLMPIWASLDLFHFLN